MSNPIYIIAEMAYSHDGDTSLAKDIITKAADAGADAISIHITHMPDYMVRHYGSGPGRVSAGKENEEIYKYIDRISLSFDEWADVVKVAKDKELDLVIMPNDRASLEFTKKLSPAAYVLSAACFEEYDFIRDVALENKHIYLRVGGSTLGEIEKVISVISKAGNNNITLLYGHQNYPTKITDTNLNYLRILKKTFGLPVGIADHIDADDEFSLIAPLLGIPLGISCIEKHITHDRSIKGEDFESALNHNEFKLLVERMKKSADALGRGNLLGLDESSEQYRKNIRKRLVAAQDISKGDLISPEMLCSKRADEGLSPIFKSEIIGRIAQNNISKDTGITFDLVTGK